MTKTIITMLVLLVVFAAGYQVNECSRTDQMSRVLHTFEDLETRIQQDLVACEGYIQSRDEREAQMTRLIERMLNSFETLVAQQTERDYN